MQKHLLLILAAFSLIVFSPAHATEESNATPSTPVVNKPASISSAQAGSRALAEEMSSNSLSLFPILPRGAGPDALPQLIPISNNRPLGGTHSGLERVIIGIHNSTRNARGLVTILSTIGGAASDRILILAPQFLAEHDAELYYPDMPETLRKTLAFWPPDGWEDGGGTKVEKPSKPISSFTALDLILMYLGEKTIFPDLKDIFIVGHGNGADFAQRYAAMGAATNLLEKEGIAVHFVLANASSYLYVTPSRPKPDSLGFATPTVGNCAMYDYYKYGLLYMNAYGKEIGENAIKTHYGDRRVIYLLGQNIAAADPSPDETCEGMFQGPNRYARGANFYAYVYQLYGDDITKRQKTYLIPKTAYNPVAMLGSMCGKSILFSDGGACENSISPTVEMLK